MKIKRMKGLLCLALVLIMCVATVTTTMAILKDMHEKEAAVMKFGKVAIMADDKDDEDEIHGSNLSIQLANSMLTNGQRIINATLENEGDVDYNPDEKLTVKAASDTEDMYIRFQVRFTFGSEAEDQEAAEAEVLALLNGAAGFAAPNGFVPYDGSAGGYQFVQHGEWFYLVVAGDGEAAERQLVTVEADQEFIISELFTLSYDAEQEGRVLEVVRAHTDIYLEVEVQAIQAEGISDHVENAEAGHNQVEDPNNLVTEGSEGLMQGGITVSEFENAMN